MLRANLRASASRGRVGGRGHGHAATRASRQHVDGRVGARLSQPPSTRNSRQQPNIEEMSVDDVLFHGLRLVGFGGERQNVRRTLNIARFTSHYGPEPDTTRDILRDLKRDFPTIIFKDAMMTFNWAKRYDVEHVLAGRWGYGEDYIRDKVKEIARCIQSYKPRLIVLDPTLFHEDERDWITVDGVNFITEEFRQNPSPDYYDPKSNSCGLKYEFALAIRHPFCVWIRGPLEAGKFHDKTVYCGGTEDVPKDKRNQEALYFQLPEGKYALGDSAYKGIDNVTIKREGQTKEVKYFIDRALNRQETYHGRLEKFDILKQRFRHGNSTENKKSLHQTAVEMVAVIVHYDLKRRPLFEV